MWCIVPYLGFLKIRGHTSYHAPAQPPVRPQNHTPAKIAVLLAPRAAPLTTGHFYESHAAGMVPLPAVLTDDHAALLRSTCRLVDTSLRACMSAHSCRYSRALAHSHDRRLARMSTRAHAPLCPCAHADARAWSQAAAQSHGRAQVITCLLASVRACARACDLRQILSAANLQCLPASDRFVCPRPLDNECTSLDVCLQTHMLRTP